MHILYILVTFELIKGPVSLSGLPVVMSWIGNYIHLLARCNLSSMPSLHRWFDSIVDEGREMINNYIPLLTCVELFTRAFIRCQNHHFGKYIGWSCLSVSLSVCTEISQNQLLNFQCHFRKKVCYNPNISSF